MAGEKLLDMWSAMPVEEKPDIRSILFLNSLTDLLSSGQTPTAPVTPGYETSIMPLAGRALGAVLDRLVGGSLDVPETLIRPAYGQNQRIVYDEIGQPHWADRPWEGYIEGRPLPPTNYDALFGAAQGLGARWPAGLPAGETGVGLLTKPGKYDLEAALLRKKSEGLLSELEKLTSEFDQIGQRTYVVPEAYKIQQPLQGMVSEDVLGQVITGVKDVVYAGRPRLQPHIQQKIGEMLKQGLSQREIARQLSVSQETVQNIKKTLGLTGAYSREASTRFASIKGPSKISITKEEFAKKIGEFSPYLSTLSKRFGEDGVQEATHALWRSLNDNPDKSRTWHKVEMWNAAREVENRGVSLDTARKGRTHQPVRIFPAEDAPADEWLSALVNSKHLSPEDSYIDAVDMMRFTQSLPPVERDYYRLRYEGFTDPEIANIWKIKPGRKDTNQLFAELKRVIAENIKKIMMVAAPIGTGVYSGAAQMESQ